MKLRTWQDDQGWGCEIEGKKLFSSGLPTEEEAILATIQENAKLEAHVERLDRRDRSRAQAQWRETESPFTEPQQQEIGPVYKKWWHIW